MTHIINAIAANAFGQARWCRQLASARAQFEFAQLMGETFDILELSYTTAAFMPITCIFNMYRATTLFRADW